MVTVPSRSCTTPCARVRADPDRPGVWFWEELAGHGWVARRGYCLR